MCEYCEGKKGLEAKSTRSDSNYADYVIEGNKLMVDYGAYSADSSFNEEIEIKFCPMCGKSL